MSNVYKTKASFTFSVELDEGVKLHELSAMEWAAIIETISDNEFKAQLVETVLNRSNWYSEIK